MSVKKDLFKQIEQAVAKKKELAKKAAREKTVAQCVSAFFARLKAIPQPHVSVHGQDLSTWTDYMPNLAITVLEQNLSSFDKKARAEYNPFTNTVTIHWSQAYIEKSGCEAVSSYDESTAIFQDAIEHLE